MDMSYIFGTDYVPVNKNIRNRNGRCALDVRKEDLMAEAARRTGKYQSYKSSRDYVRVLVKNMEEIQLESIINGAESVATLNGTFWVEDVVPLSRPNSAPRPMVLFAPKHKLDEVNKAYRAMGMRNRKAEKMLNQLGVEIPKNSETDSNDSDTD